MRIETRIAIKHSIKFLLISLACLIIWLAGNVFGIHYQQSKIIHPTGNGIAFFYELNEEQELTLDGLKEGQSVVCIFLVEKGSIEAWIETKTGKQMTSAMRFDCDGSYLFSVPFDGDFILKLMDRDSSTHVSTLMYDKAK